MQLNIGSCLLLGDGLNLLMMLTDWNMVEEELGRESTSLTYDTKAELTKEVWSVLQILFVFLLCLIDICLSELLEKTCKLSFLSRSDEMHSSICPWVSNWHTEEADGVDERFKGSWSDWKLMCRLTFNPLNLADSLSPSLFPCSWYKLCYQWTLMYLTPIPNLFY